MSKNSFWYLTLVYQIYDVILEILLLFVVDCLDLDNFETKNFKLNAV